MNFRPSLLCLGLATALLSMALNAQTAVVPPPPPPDDRMKADILLIVAHPDDETAIGSYLAKAVFDEHRRVSVIYCNHGTGGGNSHGVEQSNAMGAVREIEARTALASFGISNVWFLTGRDTPGQDVFASLQHWGHGEVLEAVVRLVRLTRPDVIITWLPNFVSGENHGDHQASGVIATEAFDCAADPTVFPAQVMPARERTDINNFTEGLVAWQPKKLYFFSDASHELTADGPAFDLGALSPSRHVSYITLAAQLSAPHLTQADVSVGALEAIKTNDYATFRKELERFHLIFGKSVVSASPRGDLFEGITSAPSGIVRAPGYAPAVDPKVSLSLGGVFAFYREFWHAHAIERIAPLVNPEIEIAGGSYLNVPLQLHNSSADTVKVALKSELPSGWSEAAGSAVYVVGPGRTVAVTGVVHCPAASADSARDVRWKASVNGVALPAVKMNVHLVEWSLPQ